MEIGVGMAAAGGRPATGKRGRLKAFLLATTMAGVAALAQQPTALAQQPDAGQAGGGNVTILAPVTVQGVGGTDGYVATRSVVGTKVDTPLVEIPQTISVVTREELDQRAVQDFGGAVA
ncbi:hypothetical protein [Azospirillum sp. TSH58]|nr:hypothetical protein [Azospirillum sp. TSH58]